MTVTESPQAQQTIAEAKALGAALAAVARSSSPDLAVPLVRAVFEKHQPQDADGWLQHCAMARILGEQVTFPADLPSEGDGADRLFVRIARAWMLWYAGQTAEAMRLLQVGEEPREASEIHMMALGPWCLGVGALLRDDREEARRYFRRATEVGSQLGTETNNAIQWAYAATFFDHKP